jgi:hypothetical protein
MTTDPLQLGPGMASTRRCECGAVLQPDDCERCAECRPRLSPRARAAEDARRAARDKITAMELEACQLETSIRQVERAVRKWSRLRHLR